MNIEADSVAQAVAKKVAIAALANIAPGRFVHHIGGTPSPMVSMALIWASLTIWLLTRKKQFTARLFTFVHKAALPE